MTTTTNSCDLKEATDLAIQKLVELSHGGGWKKDVIAGPRILVTTVSHKASRFSVQEVQETDLSWSLKVRYSAYLGDLLIFGSSFVSDDTCVRASFLRVYKSLSENEDQTKCHEIMAALGRIKS